MRFHISTGITWLLATCALGALLGAAPFALAQTQVLYGNDFEVQNLAPQITCGDVLDWRGINALYGNANFSFEQTFSVEAIYIHAPTSPYTDTSDNHGDYAIGMLSKREDDRLAVTFDAANATFLNIGLDLSSIDVASCGGPFGVDVPVMKVSLLDTPSGDFGFVETAERVYALKDDYAVLDEEILTGQAAPDETTFSWSHHVIALEATGATDGHVTVLFDLVESGYAAFDNLTITSSSSRGVVDQDLDGSPDDVDSAPLDQEVCGDNDGDGQDDCDPALLPDNATYEDRLVQTGQLVSPIASAMETDAGGAGTLSAAGSSDADSSDAGSDSSGDVTSGCNCAVVGAAPPRGGVNHARWPLLLATALPLWLRRRSKGQNAG